MTTSEPGRRTDAAGAVRSYVAGLAIPPADEAAEVAAVVARARGRRAGSAAAGRRLVRRWAPLVAAAVTALIVVTVAGPVGWGPGPAAPADSARPTLPDRTAKYSYLTGSVSKSPPGRAIMVYDQGLGV